MKSMILSIIIISFFSLNSCSTGKALEKAENSGPKPDVFCNVVKAPDPLLMGAWKCSFSRYEESGGADVNYIEYRLSKYGDQYALYFNRIFRNGRKKITEWKAWTIDGSQIIGPEKYNVKIFAQEQDVYFTIRGLDEPVKMTRIGN